MDYPETRYLAAFMAVCAEGGFHRAGEKLHLSQPAVSYQIRMLEQVMKVPLFERTPRGAMLTEAGEMLRDYCSRSLSDLAALRAQLQSGEMSARGTLKIASVSGFGRYVLFPLLAREFADVRVELRYPTQDDVIRFVAAGICDLGVIYESKTSSLFDCSPLTNEELVLIGQKDSQLTIGGLEQVSRLPFITYDESEYVIGRWMRACFGEQASLRSVAHFEELEEVMELVRLGRGVSVVPDHCARTFLEQGSLRVIRPRNRKRATNKVYAITRAGAYRSQETERLLKMLVENRQTQR